MAGGLEEDIKVTVPESLDIYPNRISANPIPEEKSELGTFRGFYEQFKDKTDIKYIAKGISNILYAPNPLENTVPEGWESITDEAVEGIPRQYRQRVWDAKTPLTQQRARAEILEEVAHQEYIDRAGWLSGTIGAFTGSIASVSSLIPIAGQIKYTSLGKGIVNNLKNQMPGIAGQILTRNAIIETTKATGSLEDFATHSFFELAMTAGIVGGMGANATIKTLDNIKSLKGQYKGMGFKYKNNKEGEFTGIKVTRGTSASAAEVDVMQQFLDQGMATWGENEVFKKIFSASPGVRMMNSTWKTVVDVGNKVFESNIYTKGMLEGKYQRQSAEKQLAVWRGMALNTRRIILQNWAEHVGIVGPLKQAQAKFKNVMSQEDFFKLCCREQRDPGSVDIPLVKDAVTKTNNIFKKLYETGVEQGEFAEGLNPVTASGYLNKVGSRDTIIGDPEGFKDCVKSEYALQDQAIGIIKQPVTDLKQQLKDLRAQKKAAKGRDKTPIDMQMRDVRAKIIAAEKEQLRKIADKDFPELLNYPELEDFATRYPEMLLDGRVLLTGKQLKELENIMTPIKEAEMALKEAEMTVRKLGTLRSFKSFMDVELSNLADKYISEAVENARTLGREETISQMQENFNKALREYKDRKEKLKIIREKLDLLPKVTKDTKEYAKLEKEFEKSKRTVLTYEREKIARKEVLNEMKAILKNNIFSVDEIEAMLKETEKATRGITRESYAAMQKRVEQAKKIVENKKKSLEALNAKYTEDAIKGKVDPELYNVDKRGKVHFVNPKSNPGLRRTTQDYDSLADAFLQSYTQQTDDKIFADLFKAVESGGTNPFKSRVMMVRDKKMEKYLENDITRLLDIHTNYLAKRFTLSDALKEYGENYHDRMEGIVNKMQAEYQERYNNIVYKNRNPTEQEIEKLMKEKNIDRQQAEVPIREKQPNTPEQQEALRVLDKDYAQQRDLVSNAIDVFQGNFALGKKGRAWMEVSKAFRNYTAATMLTGLAVLQLPEVAMNIFRHGLEDSIEGATKIIKSMTAGKYNTATRESFGELGFAINSVVHSHMNDLWGSGANGQPKYWWGKLAENAANLSGNVFLSNYITDLQQSLSGHIYQSKIIRAMDKHRKGVALSKAETEMLAFVKLDPNEWAERIMINFEDGGKGIYHEDYGAWQANFHEWQDFKAAQAFMVALRKGVDATVLIPNMLDVPFAFRDPTIAMITQFMSYGFAAVNSVLIPTLQQPEAKKLLGISSMMGLSTFVDPLRQLYKREEVDFSFKKLAISAMVNSGVFGYYLDWIQKLSAAFELPYLKDFVGDRHRNRTPWDVLGGPTGGAMNKIGTVINMFLSGKINEKGLKQCADLVPVLTPLYLRGARDKAIEAIGLPETRADAKGWGE